MFYCRCLFIFINLLFCQGVFEVRRSIVMKFCIMVGSRPNFIMHVQKFGGPLKKAKNVQNLRDFG